MSTPSWPMPDEIPCKGEHLGTAINLHGRGDTGRNYAVADWVRTTSSGKKLTELLPGYTWIYPNCPPRIAAKFREEMTQWYDMASLVNPEQDADQQVTAIREAVEHLLELVEQESAKTPDGKVVLMGISQGFSIAVLALLMGLPNVKAVVGFCSWLPFQSKIVAQIEGKDVNLDRAKVRKYLCERVGHVRAEQADDVARLPQIFLSHCADDQTVSIKHGHDMSIVLTQLGYEMTWKSYETGGHWIKGEEGLDDVDAFLRQAC